MGEIRDLTIKMQCMDVVNVESCAYRVVMVVTCLQNTPVP